MDTRMKTSWSLDSPGAFAMIHAETFLKVCAELTATYNWQKKGNGLHASIQFEIH